MGYDSIEPIAHRFFCALSLTSTIVEAKRLKEIAARFFLACIFSLSRVIVLWALSLFGFIGYDGTCSDGRSDRKGGE